MPYRFVEFQESDREDIVAIFNYFVESSFAAFPESRVDSSFFDRLRDMTRGYPAVAIKTQSGKTVGFALLRPFRAAPTFRRTAEITYFVMPEHTGRGIGGRILRRFTAAAKKMGIDSIIASVSSLNEQSLRFHRRAGFRRCGTLRSVGRKFGKDFDVVLFQMRLGDARRGRA